MDQEDSQAPSKDDPKTHPLARSVSSMIYSLKNPIGPGPSKEPPDLETRIRNFVRAKSLYEHYKANSNLKHNVARNSLDNEDHDPNKSGASVNVEHQQEHSSSNTTGASESPQQDTTVEPSLDDESSLLVKNPSVDSSGISSDGIKQEDVLPKAASGTEDVLPKAASGAEDVLPKAASGTEDVEVSQPQELPRPAFDLLDERQFPKLPKGSGKPGFLTIPPPPRAPRPPLPTTSRQGPARGGRGHRGRARFRGRQ